MISIAISLSLSIYIYIYTNTHTHTYVIDWFGRRIEDLSRAPARQSTSRPGWAGGRARPGQARPGRSKEYTL